MWTEGLFGRALVPSPSDQVDEILVYAGYGSPHFARDHMNALADTLDNPPHVEVIVGMTAREGVGDVTHREFVAVEAEFPGRFTASYRDVIPASHSKVYVWLSRGLAVRAFAGSANYSRMAFGEGRQSELLAEVDPILAHELVQQARQESVRCTASDVANRVAIVPERRWRPSGRGASVTARTPSQASIPELDGLPAIRLPLVQRNGEVHARGGLNWGQRPEEGRDPNQAYIPVPTDVQASGFFPDRDVVFSLVTDDGDEMPAKATGAGGKNLTSIPNAALGEYFRERLGLDSGARVNTADLTNYGRTDVEIYRLAEDVYYLVFDAEAGPS